MLGLSPWELVVILVVVLLLFGAKRLPELGSGLGEGIKNFRKAYRDSTSIDVSSPAEGVSESQKKNLNES